MDTLPRVRGVVHSSCDAGRYLKAMKIETTILELLTRRGPGKSICPSEAARALADDWRPLMPVVRATAAQMAEDGRLTITQGGQPVDPATARGPIRLSMP